MLGDEIGNGTHPYPSRRENEPTATRPNDGSVGEDGGVQQDIPGTTHPGHLLRQGSGSRAAALHVAPDTPNITGNEPTSQVSGPNRPSPSTQDGARQALPQTTQVDPAQREPPQAALNRANRRNQARLCKKETKAAIRVASLNIRGSRTMGDGRTGSKWLHVNQLMRDKRIGILAVQETHLTEERRDDLEKLFSKRMKIFISKDPENPTGRAGIAVVLNREITNVTGAKITEIIPGRAILTQTNWHKAEQIAVLTIYAPNLSRANENAEFWRKIKEFFTRNPRLKVDIMLGDFNVVEDMLDRLPAYTDPQEAVEELNELRNLLRLKDGWRTTFPTTKAYTFLQEATSSQSRLDRIYASEEIMQSAREWKIEPSGIPGTDHRMVSVQVAHRNAPWVGKGRWSIPNHVLKDKLFRATVRKEGLKTVEDLEQIQHTRTHEKNPQTVFANFKAEMMQLARQRDKAIIPKIDRQLRELQDALDRVNNDTTSEDDDRRVASAEIEAKIRALNQRKHQDKRKSAAARNRLEGETICKYWTSTNKASKPRDMIMELKKCQPLGPQQQPEYETNSKEMAELGRDYHDALQKEEDATNPDIREQKIVKALNQVKTKTSEAQKQDLGSLIARAEVVEALTKAKNNTAAGLDGATTELWKTIHNKHTEDTKLGITVTFDIAGLLTKVFNDILTHGLTEDSSFAEGWMCPLYKKNDKTEIANYRPITCLNTDYKLFTKCLATRLAKVAPSLIHQSQAGFIPGRRITDQTKLIRLMMQYAESTEQNGLIIALDQEKAYDKIDHTYLWRTLKKFDIPDTFTNAVKTLYANAETKIMINGHLSSSWKINRGVRQGDPLSCMLFDLAIEPLAASLRASDLTGYQIPNNTEKLIANLFADDTTVFLSEGDNMDVLQEILDDWCTAAKAKFNAGKTEVIPIGTKTFRENMIHTRKLNPNSTSIPAHIHIAVDGEAVRILGAWYGNGINAEGPWSIVLDKIDAHLERWEKSNPTMEGRKLITSMIVGGMTQYLTQVQGMPKQIEKRLTKTIRKFVWKEKRSPISEATLFLPSKEGGRALLDIQARNEAIEVMWLKAYLSLGNDRPLWALIADALLARNTPKTEEKVDKRVRQNIFLQSWKSSTTERAGTPPDLRNLQKIAKKYRVRPEGIAFSKDIVRQRPIWYHSDAHKKIRRMNHGPISECLKGNHNVLLTGDAEDVADLLNQPEHQEHNRCACQHCQLYRDITGCTHPHECALKAKALVDTLPPKWDPRQIPDEVDRDEVEDAENIEDEWTILPHNIPEQGTLANIFRIFTEGEHEGQLPEILSQTDSGPYIQAATDGSCINNGQEDAVAGAGVFYAPEDERNMSIKVPTHFIQSNQTAELLALKEVAETAPTDSRLLLELDSKYVIQNVSSRLTRNENEGYINTPNAELIKLTIARLRTRKTVTRVKWVKGHSGHERNEGADQKANEATSLPLNTDFNNRIDPTLITTGAKLTSITQSLAYKAIRKIKAEAKPTHRVRTTNNLRAIKDNVGDEFGKRPTSEAIWKSTRHKDLSRQQRYFLWMAIHDAYMIGTHWQRETFNAEYKERAICPHDGATETMEHIITKCECAGQEIIWNEMGKVWGLVQDNDWSRPSIGMALGSQLAEFRNTAGKPMKGRTRLFRILMAESTYLIWKIRCERTIQNENRPHTPMEIRARWRKSINDRLELDQQLTNKNFNQKAISPTLVMETWTDILHERHKLPENWIGKPGVLVGMGRNTRRGEG
ncbi:hypothetical protein D9615_009178 [Tricholomella constricta]|uniref:Reverse transcriptase n=1 Tax=Tricholomella constricta TaxID=117010 RepID=A0A8H5H2F1_9AGAR|nr:hypothetical protein D9615_009178 [Tricholomella constricta]